MSYQMTFKSGYNSSYNTRITKFIITSFFFSSRRRHTRWPRDWSSDVCSSDLSLTVDALNSIMRHPRSLNRDIANWRPPIKQLPGVIDHGDLTASISRFRVGPRAISRIYGYGERRKPAYLIRLRITDPAGLEVRPEIAEGWVRALIPPHTATAVHEIASGQATTFVWMVDRDYQPLRSPSSMFAGLNQAA